MPQTTVGDLARALAALAWAFVLAIVTTCLGFLVLKSLGPASFSGRREFVVLSVPFVVALAPALFHLARRRWLTGVLLLVLGLPAGWLALAVAGALIWVMPIW